MPKSIMIVDDNEVIRRNLRALFSQNSDWTVCAEAVDGFDAIEKARRFRPDFVVLDLCMPNMDGIEAARKMKDIIPKSSIVMLTAFKDKILEEKAYEVGISWVLSKGEATRIVDFARILLRHDHYGLVANSN
jgi:two-component system, NarL family, response regulator LiaR